MRKYRPRNIGHRGNISEKIQAMKYRCKVNINGNIQAKKYRLQTAEVISMR